MLADRCASIGLEVSSSLTASVIISKSLHYPNMPSAFCYVSKKLTTTQYDVYSITRPIVECTTYAVTCGCRSA